MVYGLGNGEENGEENWEEDEALENG